MKKRLAVSLLIVFIIAIFCGTTWASTCIDIEKKVSVDGGLTWHDADTPEAAPETAVGQGAKYTLTVINCGSRDLINVTVNDPTLGIVDILIGDLAAGEPIVLTESDIAQLDQPTRCDQLGEKENIASATGSDVHDNTVTDNDPAWVKCISPPQPCIDIEKLVSIDGGLTWHDADTEAEAAETEVGMGVLYKLVVTNCGGVDLTNVTINDPVLGIVDQFLGDLTDGETIVLDSDDIPELDQPGRCDEAGTYENVASVEGFSTNPEVTVTDSDPAWAYCLERGDEGCTQGYWKQPHHLDSWVSYDTSAGFYDVFDREITIRWQETSGRPRPLMNPTLLQALQARGGRVNALARHAVAALLNASNPEVSYAYTVDEVILMTQAAIDSGSYGPTKDLFQDANEAGCPLN